jgi:hypothetical protein
MNAIREASHQPVQWVRTQWGRRGFGLQARGEIKARFSQQKSTGKPGGGALFQFARISRGRDKQRRHRRWRTQRGAGGLPHAGDCAEAFLQHGCRRAGRHQQLRVEPALHVSRVRPAPGGRGCALRRGGSQHGGPQRSGGASALRPLPGTHGKLRGFERTCSSWEPSWARWRSRFSACVSGCFSACGCQLLLLRKQGACLHPPRRRTGLSQTAVFKHRCTLLLSSNTWRLS